MLKKSIIISHEEARLKLYDPDNETFQIPLKYVGEIRQTQTRKNNVSGNINDIWTEANGVNLSNEWTGRSFVQVFLKDTSGLVEDLRRSKRLKRKI